MPRSSGHHRCRAARSGSRDIDGLGALSNVISLRAAHDAHDRFERRRFAGAVSAEQRDDSPVRRRT